MNITIIVAIIGGISTILSSLITYFATIHTKKVEYDLKYYKDRYDNIINKLYKIFFVSGFKKGGYYFKYCTLFKYISCLYNSRRLLFTYEQFNEIKDIIYNNKSFVPNKLFGIYRKLQSEYSTYNSLVLNRGKNCYDYHKKYYKQCRKIIRLQRKFIICVKKLNKQCEKILEYRI